MKENKIIFTVLFVVILFRISAQDSFQDVQINPNHPKAKKVLPVLEALTNNGVPGASLAIFDKDGWWMASTGYSSLENKDKMTDKHLHYLQSVAKTYMAVGVLKLYEEGKLKLEDPISKHLEPSISAMVDRADEITIKMLLNHTSGVPEYNFDPEYASKLLQHPEIPFTAKDYIKFIKGKKLTFEPGSQYSYRNTNFVLLSMIVDQITGDHGAYLEKVIFKPLGLRHTYYQINDEKLRNEKLADSYWDRYSDGFLENVTYIQRQNVTYMVGDDGIVTTTVEAVQFLRGLLEGKLLQGATLDLMKTWVKGPDGKPRYGLGLGLTEIAGHAAIGHSGGGIGAGCELRYFPEKDLYMFVGINIGTVTESPLHISLAQKREELFQALLD
ncbi:MAG: serine hydrolase [Allomuricauda sp.]